MPSPGRIKPVLQLDVQQNEEAKMSETEYLASDSLLPTIWNSCDFNEKSSFLEFNEQQA